MDINHLIRPGTDQGPLILFATLGRTDLQAVLTDANGKRHRAQVEKRCIRAVHQFWRHTGAEIVSDGADLVDRRSELRHVFVEIMNRKLQLRGTGDGLDRAAETATVSSTEVFPTLLWTLFEPKLDPRLAGLRVVVLLDTNRESVDGSPAQVANSHSGEPVEASRILRKWIESNVQGMSPCIEVRCVSYLQQGDSLHNQTDSGGKCLSASAAAAIERVFADLCQQFPGYRAAIATTGGIPEASLVVRAAAQLYSSQEPIDCSKSEDENKQKFPRILRPELSLSARHRALDLVRAGEIVAAATLIPLDVSPEPWQLVLDHSRRALLPGGQCDPIALPLNSATRPILERLAPTKDERENGVRLCLRIGLAAEAALLGARGNSERCSTRIAEAVQQSFALAEACVVESMKRLKEARFDFEWDVPTRGGSMRRLSLINELPRFDHRHQAELLRRAASSQSRGLQDLCSAVLRLSELMFRMGRHGGCFPSDVRNALVHEGRLDLSEVEKAFEKLWIGSPENSATSLMRSEVIVNVLQQFGVGASDGLLPRWIAALESDLRRPID